MLWSYVKPSRVLVDSCVADCCILAFDTKGVIRRHMTLVNLEVIRQGRGQWILRRRHLRVSNGKSGGEKQRPLAERFHSDLSEKF